MLKINSGYDDEEGDIYVLCNQDCLQTLLLLVTVKMFSLLQYKTLKVFKTLTGWPVYHKKILDSIDTRSEGKFLSYLRLHCYYDVMEPIEI